MCIKEYQLFSYSLVLFFTKVFQDQKMGNLFLIFFLLLYLSIIFIKGFFDKTFEFVRVRLVFFEIKLRIIIHRSYLLL